MSIKLFAIVAFGASQLMTQNALASDGTITINGKITAQTCVINGNGSGVGSFTLTLPTISTSALNAVGVTAGHTGFNIGLSACGATPLAVHTYFEAASTVDSLTGRLFNSGTAGANVEVAIENANRSAIAVGAPDGSGAGLQNAVGTTTSAAGTATMNYIAAYYANALPISAGLVASTVTYSIVYP